MNMESKSVSQTELKITNSRTADRARILEMGATTDVFTEEDVEIIAELFDDYIQNGDKSPYIFLSCFSEDVIIGFACFGHREGTTGTYDLYWICADHNYRRLGTGRKLMDTVESQALKRGGYLIVLETSDKGTYGGTRMFYDSIQYQKVLHIPAFYAPDDGMVVYAKYLNEQALG